MTEHVGNSYSVPKSEIFPPELKTLLEKNKNLFSNLGFGIKGFTALRVRCFKVVGSLMSNQNTGMSKHNRNIYST